MQNTNRPSLRAFLSGLPELTPDEWTQVVQRFVMSPEMGAATLAIAAVADDVTPGLSDDERAHRYTTRRAAYDEVERIVAIIPDGPTATGVLPPVRPLAFNACMLAVDALMAGPALTDATFGTILSPFRQRA